MKDLNQIMTSDEQLALEVELGNRVYSACIEILENAQYAKQIFGDGHYMSQEIAMFAEKLLKDHWKCKLS